MSELKIKLLRPVAVLQQPRSPALGMAVVVSYLRQKGYSVDQDDLYIRYKNYCEENPLRFFSLSSLTDYQKVVSHLKGRDDDKLKRICNKLESLTNFKGYDVVAFSITGHLELSSSLLLAKHVKEKYGTKIVFGGNSMFLPILKEFVMQFPFVDYISDRYEQDFENYLESLEGKKRRFAKARNFYNIRLMPAPDFVGLPLRLYGKPLVLSYSVTSGCNLSCSFCSYCFYVGGYQEKPINKIIDELKVLRETCNTNYFVLLSLDILHNKEWCRELCRKMIKEKIDIKWGTIIRPVIDKEAIQLMRDAGCVAVFAPLESASQTLLNQMRKPPIKYVSHAINLCHNAGIKCIVDVICGYPNETKRDIEYTVDYIKKFKDRAIFKPNLFGLEYASPIFKEPEKHGVTNLKFDIKNLVSMNDRLSYEFDEINGMNWKEKQKQQMDSFYRLSKACYPNNTPHLKPLSYLLPFYFYHLLASSRIGYYSGWVSKRKSVFTLFDI